VAVPVSQHHVVLLATPARPPDVIDPPTAPPTPPPTPEPTPDAAPLAVPIAQAQARPLPVSVGSAYAVGDSIMIDISRDLAADVNSVTVDGQVGRSWGAGVSILNGLRVSGRMPQVVIVELGTNGPVDATQFDQMMQACGGAKRVVFTTVRVPRWWEGPVNDTLRNGVARYPGVAVLADWYTYSAGHPEWFSPDGYHVPPAGAVRLASLIASVV
jgi:hypothetical protein